MGFRETCASWLDPWPWLWVEVPRRVSLQSKRLACVYLVFVLAALAYVILDFISVEAWHAKLIINSGSVTAWREAPSTMNQQLAVHCTQPEQYDATFSGGWIYRPRSCRHLAGSSAFRKQGNWLFFPTYLEETYTLPFSNCSAAQAQCPNFTVPSAVSEYVELSFDQAPDGTCSCRKKDSYFAQNPEDEVLVLIHEVFPPAASFVPFLGLPEWGSVLTKVRNADGTPCEVRGKQSWTDQEASAGIAASLREWMHCAGIDLDQDPNLLARQGTNLANHLRTMGFSLQFNFDYRSAGVHRDDHDGIVCYITVSPHVEWNSNVEVERLLLPGSLTLAELQVYMYGVTPSFSFSGQFNYVSHTPIMTWLVQATVIFGLPALIMRYIVEFGIGQPSTIYRRETCRPFDIFQHLRKTQARMLISHASYKALSKRGTLDMNTLYEYLQDIYKLEMQGGKVEADELDLLWKATLTGFDADNSGKVSLQEFVSCAALIDDLQVADIVHFMDKDRKVGMMEKVLDTTRQKLKKKKSTVVPMPGNMKSVEVDRPADPTPGVEPENAEPGGAIAARPEARAVREGDSPRMLQ